MFFDVQEDSVLDFIEEVVDLALDNKGMDYPLRKNK